MNQSEPISGNSACDSLRIQKFLASDHYRMEDQELIAHLDHCPQCRAEMDSLAGDRQTWDQVATLLKPREFDQEASAIYSLTATITPAGQPYAAIQDALNCLTPTDDPHRLGRIGTYEVTGVVGVGGMGVVLKAIDPSLDRVVAIKVMAPRLANNDTARKRFAREAKAAAAVMHPNVIPIHSVSSESSVPYLVMAYNRGSSLQKRIERDAPLQLVEVLRIGSQIAAGLAAAHDQGLVHRDIKPENILLEEGVERVAITDFGLARAIDDNTITQSGAIAGTPMYMSPEQARGEHVGQPSDLFSLGSVLYALGTGTPPYQADSSYGVMRRIIDESPTPMRELNPNLPEWFARIVEKLMAKEKADRFASASEVHKLLEACLSHVQQPAAFRLPAIPGIATPPARKSFFETRTGVFVMFIMASAAIVVAVLSAQPERPSLTVSALPSAKSDSNKNKVSANDHRVRAPLTALDDYLDSMLRTPHDLAFLNLGGLGKDDNYLSFHPIHGGVAVRFPAYDTHPSAKRQGKYVDKLRQVAGALKLTIRESAQLESDGTVAGVNLEFDLKGDSEQIGATAHDFILKTFAVTANEECSFQYYNWSHQFSTKKGEFPKDVSAKEFFAEAKAGNRVYLGEVNGRMYLVPPAQGKLKSIPWNQNIWTTEVRTLSLAAAHAIRKGTFDEAITTIEAPAQSNEKSHTKGSTTAASLIVESHKVEGSGGVGKSQTHHWKLKGQSVGTMRIRVLHIEEGTSRVVSEGVYQGGTEGEQSIEVELQLENVHRPLPGAGTVLVPTMEVTVNGLHSKAKSADQFIFTGESGGQGAMMKGSVGPVQILFHTGQHEKGIQPTTRLDSLLSASKKGGASLVTVIDWKSVRDAKERDGVEESKSVDPVIQLLESELKLMKKFLKHPENYPQFGKPTAEQLETLRSDIQSREENLHKLKQELGITSNDHTSIQGTWQVTYSEDSGRIAPQELLKNLQMVITSETMIMQIGPNQSGSTYKLDPSTSPKSIDMTENGRTKKGIYDLQGDTLRICFAEQSKERPTAFDSKPDSANDVIVQMKRVVDQQSQLEAPERLNGTWQAIYVERSGATLPEKIAKEIRFTIDGNQLIKERNGEPHESSLIVKPDVNPVSIDIKEEDQVSVRGILDLRGDTLRLCTAEGTANRPKVFESQREDSKVALLILKRVVPHNARDFSGDIATEFFRRLEITSSNYPDGTLDVENAKKYHEEDDRDVQLMSVTRFDRETAMELAKTKGDLWFSELEDLQPEVLRELVKKKSGCLYLDQFSRTFEGVAEVLGQAKCPLSLSGLEFVSPADASHLAKCVQPLKLGIKEITPEVAKALAQHRDWLILGQLKKLDETSAAALARYQGRLSLNGLVTITPETAEALGNFHGERLDLNGLAALDVESALRLSAAQCKDCLCLDGLISLTPELIATLANGNSSITLQGLVVRDVKTRSALDAAQVMLRKYGKELTWGEIIEEPDVLLGQ